jgi:hypothetical protein
VSAEDPANDQQPRSTEQRKPSQQQNADAESGFRSKTIIKHHYARAPKAKRPKRINVLGWFTAVFAALAAVIYAVQAVIFQNQLDIARQQFKLAEKTSKAQLRAYVFVNYAIVSNFGDTTKPLAANVSLKNSGQTPAYKLKGWIGLKGEAFPFSGKFETLGEERRIPTVIGPGGAFAYVLPWKRPLTEEENTLLRNGTLAFYVWGEVTYNDAFENSCFMKFRYYFGGDMGTPEDGHMATASEGNDADCR